MPPPISETSKAAIGHARQSGCRGLGSDFLSPPRTSCHSSPQETPLHLAAGLGDGHEAKGRKSFSLSSAKMGEAS